MATSAPPSARSENSSAVTFVLSAMWVALALPLAAVLMGRAPGAPEWAGAALTDVLLLSGLYAIARVRVRAMRPLSSLGFVRRPTAGREAALGLLLGWGMVLLLLLPAVLTHNLRLFLSTGRPAWEAAQSSLLTILFSVLGVQLVLTGLVFRSLVETIGAAASSAVVMLMISMWAAHAVPGHALGTLLLAIGSLLLCVGFLRTRASWLPLGFQLAVVLGAGLLFGLPLPGGQTAGGVVRGVVDGPLWLGGGELGPLGCLWALPVLLVVLVVLVRVTRDYSWHYTYEPIVGAGYPMEVAPPAEHVRMEAAAAQAAPSLVQIAPVSPVDSAERQD